MYDHDLKILFQSNASIPSPLRLKKFISLNVTDCLLFVDEGEIIVVNTEYLLEIVRSASIFSIKNEDCKDLILIKSKEHFIFTIESHRMEFFNVHNFKKSDTWDYFFPSSIVGCDKNKEGSNVCVWD